MEFGSTAYQIVGQSQHGCVMLYGGEIENPNWDGQLDRICVIPVILRIQSFVTTAYGVQFSPIDGYCTSTPALKGSK